MRLRRSATCGTFAIYNLKSPCNPVNRSRPGKPANPMNRGVYEVPFQPLKSPPPNSLLSGNFGAHAVNCWDNAFAKSFFGTLKREIVYLGTIRTVTKQHRTASSTSRYSTIGSVITRPSAISPRPSTKRGQLWHIRVSTELEEGHKLTTISLNENFVTISKNHSRPS